MTHSKGIGVLVAQLGTPDAATAPALRRYLRQFLSDRRVIDYPPLLWQPILRGIILRSRPRRSARLYARIWTEAGSPLLLYSEKQVAGLQDRLGADYRVVLGMTYGQPSIATAMQRLESAGIDRVIVLPMFPQYSSTTTAAIYDSVFQAAAGRPQERKRFVPALRLIDPYYDDPQYIAAMAQHLRESIASLPQRPDHYVISFHGIPQRYIDTGDPYRDHCEQTAMLLAEAMGWDDSCWQLSFQSRFGPEAWLEPYTEDLLRRLHSQGIERPLVFSPGFVTDCLETLDELGNEGRDQFAEGGGDASRYHLAACLNDHPAWLDTLARLVVENAGGWYERESARAQQVVPLPSIPYL